MRRLLPLPLLALLACNTELAPQYRVTDLRILAARAAVTAPDQPGTWADVVPGDTLRLEALVANPLGRAPLEVRWFACAPAADGSVPPCVDERYLGDPSALRDAALRPEETGVLLVGETVTAAPGPYSVEQAEVAVAADGALLPVVELATAQPTYRCSLYAEIPVVVVAEAAGRREVALKRVRLTPDPATLDEPLAGAYVRNENPAIAAVGHGATEGAACAAAADPVPAPLPAGRGFLCALATATSAQRYNVCGPAGEETPTPETLSWQWYVTGGEFPDEGGVGNATGGAPELERPPGPFTLWVILRDGRGGADWGVREFAAVAP